MERVFEEKKLKEEMLSIVIPIYNTNQTLLDECINSINKQKASFEIILVDDGSGKELSNHLDELSYADDRIRVIHKSNEGVSVARNTGIEAACGDWILFIDSDDWIQDGSLHEIEDICNRSSAEIIFSGHTRNYTNREVQVKCATYHDGEIIEGTKKRIELLKKTMAASEYGETGVRATCYRAVWSVVFRRSFLIEKGLRFPVGVPIGEDLIFRLDAEYSAHSIQYYDNCYYHYRNNESSASIRYREEAVKDSLNELNHIREFINRTGLIKEFDEAFKFRVVEVMTVLPNRCFFHQDNPRTNKERKTQATEFYKSVLIRNNVTKEVILKLPIKRRVQVHLLLLGFYKTYMMIVRANKSLNA